jgi:hypothetical protein
MAGVGTLSNPRDGTVARWAQEGSWPRCRPVRSRKLSPAGLAQRTRGPASPEATPLGCLTALIRRCGRARLSGSPHLGSLPNLTLPMNGARKMITQQSLLRSLPSARRPRRIKLGDTSRQPPIRFPYNHAPHRPHLEKRFTHGILPTQNPSRPRQRRQIPRPKNRQGKTNPSLNAVKHGLTADVVVLQNESEDQYPADLRD